MCVLNTETGTTIISSEDEHLKNVTPEQCHSCGASYGHPNSYILLKYSQFFPHFLANIPPCLVVVHPQQLPDPVTQEGGAPLRLLA